MGRFRGLPGDEKDAPAPIQWPANGWTTQPDFVLPGVPYRVAAQPKNNVIEWMTLTTPSGFSKDTWITSVEIKPSELAVTHHICISFVPHRPDTIYNTFLWVNKQRDDAGVEVPPSQRKFEGPTADRKGRKLRRACEETVRITSKTAQMQIAPAGWV